MVSLCGRCCALRSPSVANLRGSCRDLSWSSHRGLHHQHLVIIVLQAATAMVMLTIQYYGPYQMGIMMLTAAAMMTIKLHRHHLYQGTMMLTTAIVLEFRCGPLAVAVP